MSKNGSLQTTREMVEEHLAASKTLRKTTLRSKKRAREFLIRAGILTKDGKRLAKPYR